jgi:acetyl esterase/lipase
VPDAFLIVSLVGLAFTLLALLAPRRPFVLTPLIFFAGWLTGELALFHVAWQVVATIVFVVLGALDGTTGWIGLAITGVSWLGLLVAYRRHGGVAPLLDEAMRNAIPESLAAADTPVPIGPTISRRQLLSPFRMRTADVEVVRNLAYGEHKRNRLDVYRHADGATGRPVLLQIHGGAWVIGNKRQQGQPMMYDLASRGWVCVAPNYRLSPRATFPDHLVDVKRALAWVREHIHEHGGDPSFVVVTGGSAGGHLAALLALTPNRPELQPGFEHVDTSVSACVPMYGVFDFLDQHKVRRRASMRPFLQPVVMKCSPTACRDSWELASPISQVNPDAPPFFVVSSVHDTLAWVEDARHFVQALRQVSHEPVLYAELRHAQHAFDVMYTVRAAHVVHAIGRWLDYLWSSRGTESQPDAVSAGQPKG